MTTNKTTFTNITKVMREQMRTPLSHKRKKHCVFAKHFKQAGDQI